MNLNILKEEFDKYANLFDMNNYDVNYKYNHSYRVMNLSNMISSNMKLNDENILLATTIGLLHDIGRFKQLEMYGSYDDKNIDHARLGSKILFEDNLISKFKIDEKYYDTIDFSIRNHNKLKIEQVSEEKKLIHAKIIRDADKLDILKAHIINKDYKLKEAKESISEKVKQSFYNRELINRNDIENSNDKILILLAFIFDINFKPSLDYIKKERLIEKFYESIENKEIFEEYFKYAFRYLEKVTD